MDRVFATILALPTIISTMAPMAWSGQTNTLGRPILRESEYSHSVTILWGAGAENETQWNDIAVWCMETFGLPGDRYVTDISSEHMTWFFRVQQDAVFMRLKFGSQALTHAYG
jgi:hypothetical protein